MSAKLIDTKKLSVSSNWHSDKTISLTKGNGICLLDVSVYMALCEILGISLNEFIAGEDIEPVEVVQKSEENLIQVTENGEHRKHKLKKIIVLLAVFGSVMTGILIYLLTFKNQPRVNYIEPLAQDSTDEGKITIQPGKEIGILALYYEKNALSVTPFSDIENENVDSCKDEVYYLTVKFEKDDDAWD